MAEDFEKEPINVLMGDYEIFCDKAKSAWRVWDRLNSEETIYFSLERMLFQLEWELERIELSNDHC